jgi:hypothetical protein
VDARDTRNTIFKAMVKYQNLEFEDGREREKEREREREREKVEHSDTRDDVTLGLYL